MIYIYSLPSEILQYPDVRNIYLKSYLKKEKISNKYIDLNDYLINNILYKNKNLKKAIDNIKNENIDLLEANKEFIKEFNIFLKKYNMFYNRKFNFDYKINDLNDFVIVSDIIADFTNLFPIENYEDEDVVYLGIQFGYQLPFAINIAKKIKKNNGKTKIIIGGNYLTQISESSQKILNEIDCFDAIILYGHGSTLKNIIYFYREKDVSLYNIVLRNNKLVIRKNIKDKIDNYFLDYSDINFENYLSRKRIMPIILNYGCYHHSCTFCAHHYYYGNYMQLNTKNICNNILKEYNNNKFDCIVFLDECIPAKQILEVADYFVKQSIKIKWMMETRLSEKFLKNENIKLLHDSGCQLVSFGIESYNKKVLNHMNKNIDLKIIKPILKNFYNNYIIVSSTFMIGYPYENIYNIYKTLNFIKHFKYIDLYGLNVFQLIRNSTLANNMNIDFKDIGLIYVNNKHKRERLYKIIKNFDNTKKLRNLKSIKPLILNRCDYLFIDRNKFSINYREEIYEKKH